ncbi:MAG: hypothetical protein WCW17_00450 [Patescibacteria group bacterium]|jgi:Tfp pilus assembly protein PilO
MKIKNKLLILILVISSLIELAIIIIFIVPQISNLTNRQNKSDSTSSELEITQTKYDEINKLIENKDEVLKLGVLADNLMPDESDNSSFMLELDYLAKSSNLAIPTISFDAEIKSEPAPATKTEEPVTKNNQLIPTAKAADASTINATAVGYQATVSGSYTDFLDFLCKLESSKRFNSLPSLSLSPSDGKVSVALNGTVYYLSSDAENAKFDIDKLKAIQSLIEYKKFVTPSSVGSDGRDNPFAAISP